MPRPSRKKKKKSHAGSYIVITLVAIAALAFAAREVLGQNGYLARRRRRIQIQALTNEIDKLKQENSALARRIQELRSDPEAIEKLAREQLKLGRPGDVIVTLPTRQAGVADAGLPTGSSTSK